MSNSQLHDCSSFASELQMTRKLSIANSGTFIEYVQTFSVPLDLMFLANHFLFPASEIKRIGEHNYGMPHHSSIHSCCLKFMAMTITWHLVHASAISRYPL